MHPAPISMRTQNNDSSFHSESSPGNLAPKKLERKKNLKKHLTESTNNIFLPNIF